jgi:hypothetical protein
MNHQVQILWDREPPSEYLRGRVGSGPIAKTLVETIGLPFIPSVIVSTEFEDKERLAAIVKNLGFAVTYTDVSWPRDIVH